MSQSIFAETIYVCIRSKRFNSALAVYFTANESDRLNEANRLCLFTKHKREMRFAEPCYADGIRVKTQINFIRCDSVWSPHKNIWQKLCEFHSVN